MAAQFKAVSEAYDVLCDEERRASYDRMRARAAGGMRSGLRPCTAEEAAAMLRGMREMARLRREGMRRTVKAPPIHVDVRVSLEKLHRGYTKGVRVVRRCVDSSGTLYDETKARHGVCHSAMYNQHTATPDSPATDVSRGHPQRRRARLHRGVPGAGQRDR